MDEPDGDSTAQSGPPPPLREYSFGADTPMGQVDSLGNFARSLGARRVKIALAVGGGLAMLLALLSALS